MRAASEQEAVPPSERSAIVIGAALPAPPWRAPLRASWTVTLLERQPERAKTDAQAGVFHPVLTRRQPLRADDACGFPACDSALAPHSKPCNYEPVWDECGVLQLARQAGEASAPHAASPRWRRRPSNAQYVTREEASASRWVPVADGGPVVSDQRLVKPASLIHAQLARPEAGWR
jgi:tRNA 5-methylaminomethyl-2-thiouridine biosynthesis bifunctional protein